MIRAQSSIQRLIFSWWIQYLIHCWSSIHWLKPGRIHSQVITYLHPFPGVSMQQKYIFGKHCTVCEKQSLLKAFLSHHYRFLVERQLQQDSRVEQKAGRAISAKLESIENFAPVLFTKGQTASERVGFPRCFFVNSHSGISQFSMVRKGQSDAPPPLPRTLLWYISLDVERDDKLYLSLQDCFLHNLLNSEEYKLLLKRSTFHAPPCQPSSYIDWIPFLRITLFFLSGKQHFTSIFWNFIADTRLAEKKIIYLIQDHLLLIQDYLSRKDEKLSLSN